MPEGLWVKSPHQTRHSPIQAPTKCRIIRRIIRMAEMPQNAQIGKNFGVWRKIFVVSKENDEKIA